MDFRGKPNSSVTTQSGRIGRTDDKGFLTVDDDIVLKQFQGRMARGGLKKVTIYECKTCNEKFDKKNEWLNHTKIHVKKKVKK